MTRFSIGSSVTCGVGTRCPFVDICHRGLYKIRTTAQQQRSMLSIIINSLSNRDVFLAYPDSSDVVRYANNAYRSTDFFSI